MPRAGKRRAQDLLLRMARAEPIIRREMTTGTNTGAIQGRGINNRTSTVARLGGHLSST
jgi:hypothetical protein